MRDRTILASEYALGTLVGEEQEEADRLYREQPDFRAMVDDWEHRLAPLGEAVDPIAPPASVWKEIRGRLGPQNKSLPKGISAVFAAEGEWRPVNEKVHLKSLFIDSEQGAESYILKFLPGGMIEQHSHGDWNDECIVLEGEIRVGDVPMKPGDFHVATRGAAHPTLYSEMGGMLYVRSRQVTGV